MGEWAKKLDCWKKIEEFKWRPSKALEAELRSRPASNVGRPEANEGLTGATAAEVEAPLAAGHRPIPSFNREVAKDTDNLQGGDAASHSALGVLSLRKVPVAKASQTRKILYKEAERLGFRAS